MLIPLSTLVKKHNLNIRGIIHVGAHYAEEHEDYLKEGVRDIVYIEASKKSFYHLCRKRFDEKVKLFNIAVADVEGEMEMHTETANQGQSSSLLQPGTHLKHYPSIKFDSRETVAVTLLDKLPIDKSLYNMMNIDVQGAELMVLKGSHQTLDYIDYIYLEVNKEEVYLNCAKVEEIDHFLNEFSRVETAWTGQGWGDALYIRKQTPGKIVSTPAIFRIKHPTPYPSDNHYEFERWFYDHVRPRDIQGDRHYLPIFWTAYYCKHQYGKDKFAIQRLQIFLDRLDKSKKYFTIVQYDDGILNKVDHLDLKIFGMGGGRIDYPLPLICEPHKFQFPGIKKDIFCSFIGRITHPIRKTIVDKLTGKEGYYISTKNHSLKDFCHILARSKYVLCPRGYGKTSFRIMEALQYGAAPIYISDDFIIPHDGKPDLIYLKPSDIHLLDISNDNFFNSRDHLQIFNEFFTYESNKHLILQNL